MMDGETDIPLVAAFKGVTFLPYWFAIGHNNLNPKLILTDTGVQFRNGFFMQQKAYGDIAEVDILVDGTRLMGVATSNIDLRFKGTVFTFAGNLNSEPKLKDLLKRFAQKGCPLSAEAAAFMKTE